MKPVSFSRTASSRPPARARCYFLAVPAKLIRKSHIFSLAMRCAPVYMYISSYILFAGTRVPHRWRNAERARARPELRALRLKELNVYRFGGRGVDANAFARRGTRARGYWHRRTTLSICFLIKSEWPKREQRHHAWSIAASFKYYRAIDRAFAKTTTLFLISPYGPVGPIFTSLTLVENRYR